MKTLHILASFILQIISLLLSPIYYWVARYGYGSDISWKMGFLPLSVHYYSPVPDKKKVLQYLSQHSLQDMPGVSFNESRQMDLVKTLGQGFGKECAWPRTHSEAAHSGDYYADNNAFAYSSAAFLYSMIRYKQPKRLIEVDAGHSTRVINQALLKNQKENGYKCHFISIDPYPEQFTQPAFSALTEFRENFVEDVPLSIFTDLSAGDILFIDTSHVIKTGGDVNYLYLQILPRLNPGVVVHIHDIYLPFEYPSIHFTNKLKYLWTEQYLLQALLADNDKYQILLACYYMQTQYPEIFAEVYPSFNKDKDRPSSSFYIQRI